MRTVCATILPTSVKYGSAFTSVTCGRSRKENPQKLTQLSSRSHPRHLVGKRTAQKDITIDTTSDSQVNSNFPNRWSPASLTFNNYFYLFLYLYITWITINNNAPHLKSPKNQNRRAALGRPALKITGGLQLVCGRPTLALVSPCFSREILKYIKCCRWWMLQIPFINFFHIQINYFAITIKKLLACIRIYFLFLVFFSSFHLLQNTLNNMLFFYCFF